jgi:hypothetical protein
MLGEKKNTPTTWPVVILKSGLLACWAAWLTVVFATNVLDGARALGVLPESWAFTSGNFHFLTETTARYGTPPWLNALLFAGVIGWEGMTALLFWLAWGTFSRTAWRTGPRGQGAATMIYAAFTAGLTLWLAFAIADEVFISYSVEGTHLRLFVAQLATLLAVELLPEGPREAARC